MISSRQAQAGRLVDSGLPALHPGLVHATAAFPALFGGEQYRDAGRPLVWDGLKLLRDPLQPGRLQRLGFDRAPQAMGRPGRSAVRRAARPLRPDAERLDRRRVRKRDPAADPSPAGRPAGRRSGRRAGRPEPAGGAGGLDRRPSPHPARSGPTPATSPTPRRSRRSTWRTATARPACASTSTGASSRRRCAGATRRRPPGLRVARGRLGLFGRPDRAPARRAAPRGRRRLHRVRPLPRRAEALEFPDRDAGRPRAVSPSGGCRSAGTSTTIAPTGATCGATRTSIPIRRRNVLVHHDEWTAALFVADGASSSAS